MRTLIQRVTDASVTIDGRVNGQVDGQVTAQVDGQVAGQIDSQVVGQIDRQVDGQIVGQIAHGYLILLGVGHGDTEHDAARLVNKIVHLRLFRDERGRFDRSLLDVAGGALVVSQFTLWADCRKGRRPSFTDAARPEVAEPLCDRFADLVRQAGVDPVQTGRFGADMRVRLTNDGPVTLWLDSADLP